MPHSACLGSQTRADYVVQDVEGDDGSGVRDLALKLVKKLIDEVVGNSPSHSAHLLLVLEEVWTSWKCERARNVRW